MQHDFVLLDRSGSMNSLWTDALGSINAYVKKLAEDNVDTGVTLAVFDDNLNRLDFQVVRDRITPSTWRPVSNVDAVPRGGTPLNDAVGKIVALANAGNYDRVAIIIMTDGHENASKELSVDDAKKLLDACRAKGWQVIFLGANFDNATQAASYGTQSRQTVQSSAQNLATATASVAIKRGLYGATGQSIVFDDAEKAQLKQP